MSRQHVVSTVMAKKKIHAWAAELEAALVRGNFALARKSQKIIPEMKELAKQEWLSSEVEDD